MSFFLVAMAVIATVAARFAVYPDAERDQCRHMLIVSGFPAAFRLSDNI
jgi:hypothetical protein